MPSIFTRARTTSTKNLPKAPGNNDNSNGAAGGGHGFDEFGRVNSRGPPIPTKDKDKRQRSQSTTDKRRATNASSATLGDGAFDNGYGIEDGFLPTALAPLEPAQQPYGYLSHEAHIILSVEDITKLVEIVSEELAAKGLTTPFLFSNSALDISTHAVRRMISSFLYSVNPSLTSAPGLSNTDFREEAKFAGPHELGMVLRWGLARVVRVVSGTELRGLVGWETYMQWRKMEHDSDFSKTEFNSFIQLLPQQIRSLSITLLTFLTRLLAHSTSSGLTPATLSSLFGPLIFGLGGTFPGATTFHASYAYYLRACHATEHILLAFVRLQVAQTSPSSPPPRRLLSWIQGYPAMLVPFESFERPRRGVKTLRVASVRRNVRMYTPDLLRTCAGWARGPEGGGVRASREWSRIAPEKKGGDRLEPRYTDAYRKRLDLPATFYPQTGLGGSSSTLSTPSVSTASSTSSTKSSFLDDLDFSLGGALNDESKFRNLTDLRWGEFESLGFSEGDTKKLQFDLNESARSERNSKRNTLTWADFSSAGFTRTDSSLSTTLEFAQPLEATITQWPSAEKDLQRKLKKNVQKALPAFGWDTAPVMDGREDVVEEGFLDVFCDLLYGGGWMDRGEGTFKECNWALVEFKSLPTSRSESTPPVSRGSDLTSDPRSSSSLLLFEEFVPLEYRTSLAQQGSKPAGRSRFLSIPSLLSPTKKTGKQWKQAATLNGRPYVIGAVPHNPGSREAEFERLLQSNGSAVTKVITLNTATTAVDNNNAGIGAGGRLRVQTPVGGEPVTKRTISSPLFSATSPSNVVASPSTSTTSPLAVAPPTPAKPVELPHPVQTPSSPVVDTPSSMRKSRFRFPVGRSDRHGMMIPSGYDTVDFETRLASYSDDELNDSEGDKRGRTSSKAKRMSKDDAWVDILVASGAKRMTNQDAELRPRAVSPPMRGLTMSGGSGGRSDPELASQEVAQALAAVRQISPEVDDGTWNVRQELSREVEPREPSPEVLQQLQRQRSPTPTDVSVEDAASPREIVPKKKPGYFDLHPDRRPIEPTQSPYTQTNVNIHTDIHPRDRLDSNISAPYDDSVRDTLYSEGDFEPTSVDGERQPDGDIEVPAFIDSSPTRFQHELSHEHAKTDSMTLPASLGPSSKTAQLIEMYRERERQQQQASPSPTHDVDIPALVSPQTVLIPPTAPLIVAPKPSRLPVRSSSLPKDQEPFPPMSIPAVSPVTASASPSQTLEHEEEDIHEQNIPPFVAGELGRSSPMRYVHGAPLHNVLEEGEEEDA